MSVNHSYNAVSPLDGRYASKVASLAPYFSEAALMRYRVVMEGEYLIALSSFGKCKLRKFSEAEIKKIRALYTLTDADVEAIKKFESVTNHDVKAVEYFMKEKLKKTSLRDSIEWIHFALTSEDTNNIAYALMLSDSLDAVMLPELKALIKTLNDLAKKYANLPMLARTHGQSASPTTFGKEMKVFVARLEKRLAGLQSIRIQAKLNGATGNWNAHTVAYPTNDWMAFSKKFIEHLNKLKPRASRLEPNLVTTQIECHDSYVAVFDTLRRINTILLDFNQDMWRYISDAWVVQRPKEGEIGSSAMPHKINPIDFENAEGNLGLANALFEFFARKLPISRLQRDLSDSTVERNFGVAFAHSLLAYQSTMKGLGKIAVNEVKIREALADHPEVIAEAIQTILRREGAEMPYEKLKALTRGKVVTLDTFREFIETLKVTPKVKKELFAITPENYIGLAKKIAK